MILSNKVIRIFILLVIIFLNETSYAQSKIKGLVIEGEAEILCQSDIAFKKMSDYFDMMNDIVEYKTVEIISYEDNKAVYMNDFAFYSDDDNIFLFRLKYEIHIVFFDKKMKYEFKNFHIISSPENSVEKISNEVFDSIYPMLQLNFKLYVENLIQISSSGCG